ncbi:unnamed protein product [Cuscuta campestris]|uniref:DCD domain-containing protein n=1 Tax=Cuscuta campestris TaxID=132261 RepID=A0A484KJB9_9ASTE|nr:unnamed protein product [Cuscuta campestris]
MKTVSRNNKVKKKRVSDSSPIDLHKKTPISLKPKEKITKKSLSKKPALVQEGEASSQVNDKKEGVTNGIKVIKHASLQMAGKPNEQHVDEKPEELEKSGPLSTEKKTTYDEKSMKLKKSGLQSTEKKTSIDEKSKTLNKRDQLSPSNHIVVEEWFIDRDTTSGGSQRPNKCQNTQLGDKSTDEKCKEVKKEDVQFTEKKKRTDGESTNQKKRNRQSPKNHGGTTQVKDKKDSVEWWIKDGDQTSDGSQRPKKEPNTQHRSKSEQHTNAKSKELKKKGKPLESRRCGGMIFMCNTKTKPDCFRYHVMGVSRNKQDVVMHIKPGLKLFLYDFDVKLLYGVYEATSAGGVKLEPEAFGGAFPAQVRFVIKEDCLPLPENVFKKAIKENYDERTHKFKTELSVSQVKQLIELFRPMPWLHPTSKASFPESVQEPASERSHFNNHRSTQNDVPHDSPLFLTEKEYRSYGLRQGRQHVLSDSPAHANHISDHYRPAACITEKETTGFHHPYFSARVDRALNQFLLEQERDQSQKETSFPETYFPGEKEYRNYGLKGYQEITANVQHPSVGANDSAMTSMVNHGAKDYVALYRSNPYNDSSTTSLVNRYLSLPRTQPDPIEPYSLTGRDPYISEANYSGRVMERENLPSPYTNYLRGAGGNLDGVNGERGNPRSPYGQTYHQYLSSSPRSLRYPHEAGPSSRSHY